MRFLKDTLARGPKQVSDVEEAAAKAHLDSTALEQARADLGVVVSRGMPGIIIRARIDRRLKEEAEVVLAANGLTVSDAFRLMMLRVAEDKLLPFERPTPKPTQKGKGDKDKVRVSDEALRSIRDSRPFWIFGLPRGRCVFVRAL